MQSNHHILVEAVNAVRHTIAIIPIRIEQGSHNNNNNNKNYYYYQNASSSSSSSNPQQHHNDDDDDHYDYNHHLSILQLTATITSLYKHHFPRIVIAGVSPNERQVFQSMIQLFHQKKKQQQQQQQQHLDDDNNNNDVLPPMELVYVHIEGREEEWRNVPKMALMEFQRAVRESSLVGSRSSSPPLTKRNNNNSSSSANNNNSSSSNNNNNNNNNSSSSDDNFVTSWLGTNPHQWQHIYFSEPDLLLQTNPTALPILIREMNKGRILTAHRLHPIPHIQQFGDILDDDDNRTAAVLFQKNKDNNNQSVLHQEQQRQQQRQEEGEAASLFLVRYMDENMLPDLGPFQHVELLQNNNNNPQQEEGRRRTFCCDQGNYFPANKDNSSEPIKPRKQFGCPGTFELCGFQKYKEQQRQRRVGKHEMEEDGGGGGNRTTHHWKYQVLEAHKFLIPYNLIALGEGYGTGIPLVHAHQRVCKVQKEVCL
jgi:hypothetical protein